MLFQHNILTTRISIEQTIISCGPNQLLTSEKPNSLPTLQIEFNGRENRFGHKFYIIYSLVIGTHRSQDKSVLFSLFLAVIWIFLIFELMYLTRAFILSKLEIIATGLMHDLYAKSFAKLNGCQLQKSLGNSPTKFIKNELFVARG